MFLRKLAVAAVAGLFFSFSTVAAAEEFPNKPIKIIAPSSPGGVLDLTSRLVADKLSKNLDGHAVVVENMPGGGGIIGIRGMLRAEPDGHTLVMGSLGPNAANYALYDDLPYEASDFAPVMNVIAMPSVLIVSPDLPVTNLEEFKEYALENNEDISMAIATLGASSHLIGQMMQNEMGFDAINVVYKGASPAVTDLVGGQVDFMIDNMITALPMINSGRVRAIAAFGEERSPLLPDLPTVSEQGYPELTGGTWIGLLTSAEVPAETVAQLNKLFNEVLADEEVRASLQKQGGEPLGGSPQEFKDFIDRETERWANVIKAANITIE